MPLYGICTISIPAIDFNNSIARYGEVPVPLEPKLSSFGRAFASAIKSFSDFTGNEGCTSNRFGPEATSVIGAISLIGSYGSWR